MAKFENDKKKTINFYEKLEKGTDDTVRGVAIREKIRKNATKRKEIGTKLTQDFEFISFSCLQLLTRCHFMSCLSEICNELDIKLSYFVLIVPKQ